MAGLHKRMAPLVMIFLLLPGLVRSYEPGLAAAAPPPPAQPNPDQPLEDAPPDKEGDQAIQPELPQAPPTLPITDQFGYTLDDQTFNWADASAGGTEVNFLNPPSCNGDDCWTQVSLPFNFNFYEHAYNAVTVTTNGILVFGDSSSGYPYNSPIPLETLPNNHISPFWDDLDLGTIGHVYQWNTGSSFVIEWSNVIRHVDILTETLTFEAILYPNGNILFQYQTLNGDTEQCAVGIEDADGVDGLQYLYKSAGLSENFALLFTRPGEAKRSKILPTYLGQFTKNGKTDFTLEVVNTGEEGPDTYDLLYASSSPGWGVIFLNGSTGMPLSDTNGNSQPDTGLLNELGSFPVKVRVQTPNSNAVGASTRITVTARSSGPEYDEAKSLLDSSVPAPFGYALSYGETGQNQGIHFGGVSYFSHLVTQITSFFGGSTIALRRAPGGAYLYVWEQSGEILPDHIKYTDIRYMLLDRYGQRQFSLGRQLTDNSHVLQRTDDRFPVVASTPDNRFGVAWVRSVQEATSQVYNVFLQRLTPNGNLLGEKINITNNNQGFGPGLDGPKFDTPRLEATSDNRFMLGWVQHKVVNEISQDDVMIAVYNSDGSLVKQPTKITDSASTDRLYLNPALASLGYTVYLLYTVYNPVLDSYSFESKVLNSDGSNGPNPPPINGSSVTGSGVVQLSDGNILVAWIERTTGQVKYSILSGSTYNPLMYGDLPIPNRRSPSDVSVTQDRSGRGIVVWMDSRSNFLYYALVNSSGILTNPMAFHAELESTLYFSATHRGAVPYEGFAQAFLPLIRK